MQAVKNMAVSAKEKASNATAKVEEKMNKEKASANEKVNWICPHLVCKFNCCVRCFLATIINQLEMG